MNELEDLKIYKQYLEMIYYVENITIKYPKVEKYSLVSKIKNITYGGMECIINSQKVIDRNKRLSILNNLDTNLKMIKVLVRVSKKKSILVVRIMRHGVKS